MEGNIIIADDDRSLRTVLAQALTRAGCKVKATGTLSTMWRWVESGEGEVLITDDWVDKKEAKTLHEIDLISIDEIKNVNGVILAVGHDSYRAISLSSWEHIISKNGILLDVKSVFDKNFFNNSDLNHWRL